MFQDDLLYVITSVNKGLNRIGINAKMLYRFKTPCSIIQKILTKNLLLNDVHDLLGFRIVVNLEQDCYRVIDIVNNTYNTYRVKDYIKFPKDNGYKSLHIIVSLNGDEQDDIKVEIQTRTKEMHAYAEAGEARHDRYKKEKMKNFKNFFLEEILSKEAGLILLSKADNILKQFNWILRHLLEYQLAMQDLTNYFYDNIQLGFKEIVLRDQEKSQYNSY